MDGEGLWCPDPSIRRPSLAHDDPLPPPPYVVSLTLGPHGWERPYTIRSRPTGQSISGHVESRAAAHAIASAMNSAAARGILGLGDT